MPSPTVITFDVYGTLVQWDQTVRDAIAAALGRHGRPDADLDLAANAFEAESRRLQTTGAFRSYRAILRDSLRPALATVGLDATREDTDRLIEALSAIPAFDEVPPVLARLAEHHRLAPISNTDDDLLAGTLAGLGDVFATTVTAEQARAYKPNPGLFRFAARKLDVTPGQWLHVAQGSFSDLTVCAALDIRVVWVNRTRATLQDGLAPLAVIDDLAALPEIVAAL